MSKRRITAAVLAGAVGLALLAVPSQVSAWGDVAFSCDGQTMSGHSQYGPPTVPWTADIHSVCTPRTRYRKSNGTYGNWGYGPIGGYAYAAAAAGPFLGASHQGFNDYDTWVGTIS